MTKHLILLGMHRSGTSLTAQWINSLGIHVGDELLEKNRSNKKGHFEDIDFLNFHRKVLEKNGFWETGLNYNGKKIHVDDSDLKEIKAIISAKDKAYNQWAWKEPRTCLFTDLYRDLLPNAKYLVIIRNPQEVVDSLYRREKGNLEAHYEKKGLLGKIAQFIYAKRNKNKLNKEVKLFEEQWYLYNKALMDHLNSIPAKDYILVELNDFTKYEKQIFNTINEWGLEVNYNSYSNIYDNKLLQNNVENNAIYLSEKTKLLYSKIQKAIQLN